MRFKGGMMERWNSKEEEARRVCRVEQTDI